MLTPREPHTVFLLSPANLSGERAKMLLAPLARFDLARRLQSREGAPLGAVFSFVSGLYFRGKASYARAFARPAEGRGPGEWVMSAGEGLRPLDELVTADRLRAWAEVEVSESNDRFTGPLVDHASALERACGATTRFVLLGSVASRKYVGPLVRVFGDHLLFPADFVGRGDMSRGALLLDAVRAGRELPYQPVEGARVRGARAKGIAALRDVAAGALRDRAPSSAMEHRNKGGAHGNQSNGQGTGDVQHGSWSDPTPRA